MKVWHKSNTIRAALLAVGSAVAALPALGPALADETIKIGVPMSLSGRFVSYGASGKRGVEMAAEAFGSTINGRKIEFLYRDVQSDPQATMSAVNELINSQDVDFLIGPTASPIVAAAIPPWQQGKPIWILNGGSTTAVEELLGGEERFFHTYPYSYHYHTSELNALKHYLGDGKKVAVIYADDTYGQSHLPFVQKFYSEAGFEIVAEEMIRANTMDMSPVLTKISRAKPDILIALLQSTDAVTLAKQIHSRKLEVPYLVGMVDAALPRWQEAVGEAQEGWIGVTTYLPGVERPANQDYPKLFPSAAEWEEKFRKRYNVEPDFMDIGHYTATAMLLIALERSGGEVEQAAEELRKMDIVTVNGRGKFEETGFGTKQQAFTDMVVFQRKGGKNVIVWPLEIATGELTLVAR